MKSQKERRRNEGIVRNNEVNFLSYSKSIWKMSKFFSLNKLFSLEKAFEMCHLPHSSADKDEDLKMNFDNFLKFKWWVFHDFKEFFKKETNLHSGPPKDLGVCVFWCLSKFDFSRALKVLLLLNLVHLIEKLSDTELQFREFFLFGDFFVSFPVLANLKERVDQFALLPWFNCPSLW